MDRVLFDGVVNTDYGQFDLVWDDDAGFDGDFDPFFAGQVNGLVGAARGDGVYLILARRSGGSAVRIVLSDSAPPQDPSYQDVVEVSVAIPAGVDVQWMSWAGESTGSLEQVSSGTYRLRVSARDRDAGANGEFADRPVDAYLLELWPAPKSPDAILAVGSDDARYWHRELGGRR